MSVEVRVHIGSDPWNVFVSGKKVMLRLQSLMHLLSRWVRHREKLNKLINEFLIKGKVSIPWFKLYGYKMEYETLKSILEKLEKSDNPFIKKGAMLLEQELSKLPSELPNSSEITRVMKELERIKEKIIDLLNKELSKYFEENKYFLNLIKSSPSKVISLSENKGNTLKDVELLKQYLRYFFTFVQGGTPPNAYNLGYWVIPEEEREQILKELKSNFLTILREFTGYQAGKIIDLEKLLQEAEYHIVTKYLKETLEKGKLVIPSLKEYINDIINYVADKIYKMEEEYSRQSGLPTPVPVNVIKRFLSILLTYPIHFELWTYPNEEEKVGNIVVNWNVTPIVVGSKHPDELSNYEIYYDWSFYIALAHLAKDSFFVYPIVFFGPIAVILPSAYRWNDSEPTYRFDYYLGVANTRYQYFKHLFNMIINLYKKATNELRNLQVKYLREAEKFKSAISNILKHLYLPIYQRESINISLV